MSRYRNSFDDWKHRGPPDPLGLFPGLMDVEMSDDGLNQVQWDADNEEADQEQKDKDCTNHAWTSIRARSRP